MQPCQRNYVVDEIEPSYPAQKIKVVSGAVKIVGMM